MSNSATPWTVALQAPLSMGFPRHKYWSGLPFPPPGDLPNPGIKPVSPALAGRFFTMSLLGSPRYPLLLWVGPHAQKGPQPLAKTWGLPHCGDGTPALAAWAPDLSFTLARPPVSWSKGRRVGLHCPPGPAPPSPAGTSAAASPWVFLPRLRPPEPEGSP